VSQDFTERIPHNQQLVPTLARSTAALGQIQLRCMILASETSHTQFISNDSACT